jgi:hypothetical protein
MFISSPITPEDALPMRLRYVSNRIFLLALCAALAASALFAQAPLEPAQLPARTIFYLIWRGTPTGDIRKSNSLMALWDDPDFAPARAALLNNLMSDSKKKGDGNGLTREEISSYATLLDNSFTIGYLPREGPAPKPATPGGTVPAWTGTFLVYDRTGKEQLLSKAVLRLRANSGEIPTVSEVTIAGVKALKLERKTGTNYWAETGNYAVAASEPAVFEEILKRVTQKTEGSSVTELAAYREAKPLLSGGVVEFFLRVPEIKEIAGDPDSASPQMKLFWNTIHLDAVHVFAGHISLEGTRTRLLGAVLGDTSQGTPFDIWSAGQTQPSSLPYVTPDTVYYNETQIDLLGIYNIAKRAFSQSGQNGAAMVEAAGQSRIGMTLPDAFALTNGEFGTLQSSPALDADKKIFFLGISDKPGTMKILHTIFGEQITSEHDEDNVTYFKIASKSSKSGSGIAMWDSYQLAMTPNLLLGSTTAGSLQDAIAHGTAATANSLPKNFRAARAQFPRTLSGFSFVDFQKLDWPAIQQNWAAQAVKAASQAKTSDAKEKAGQWNEFLLHVNPAVFPRHLHSMTGASWKDDKGVHFDEWMD